MGSFRWKGPQTPRNGLGFFPSPAWGKTSGRMQQTRPGSPGEEGAPLAPRCWDSDWQHTGGRSWFDPLCQSGRTHPFPQARGEPEQEEAMRCHAQSP